MRHHRRRDEDEQFGRFTHRRRFSLAKRSLQRIGEFIDASNGAVEAQCGKILRHGMECLVRRAAKFERLGGIAAIG